MHPRMIVPSVLAEVNKEVKLVATGQKKRHGSYELYLTLTPEEKARVAQCGGVNGVRAAGRSFDLKAHG